MQKRVICNSDRVLLWLGSSIGTLHHCTDYSYVRPFTMETAKTISQDLVYLSGDLLRDGNFWSETGIGNRSFFQT